MKNVLFKTAAFISMVLFLGACSGPKGRINYDGTYTYYDNGTPTPSGNNTPNNNTNNSGNDSSGDSTAKSEKRASFDKDKETLKENGYTVNSYLGDKDMEYYEEKFNVPSGDLFGYILTYRLDRFDILYFESASKANSYYKNKKDEMTLTLKDWKIIVGEKADQITGFIE